MVIQSSLIFLLAFMLWMQGEEHTNRIVVPVEICHEAKIESVYWRSTIETKNSDLKLATEKLESDRERVIRNFTAKGLPREDIGFVPIEVQKSEDDDGEKYHLRQIIEVRSHELERVRRIRDESGELLKFRIQFNTSEPSFELANFSLWLRSAMPILIQEAKILVKESKDSGLKGELKLHSWKMHPIFSKDFVVCDSRSNDFESSSLHARIRATVVFVLR